MTDGTLKLTDFGLAKFSRPILEVIALHNTLRPSAVHRDLRPLNVLLESGTLRALAGLRAERGVARRLRAERGGGAIGSPQDVPCLDGLTETGYGHGQPAVRAPEQARGETDRIGRLPNVYGLGRYSTACSPAGRPSREDEISRCWKRYCRSRHSPSSRTRHGSWKPFV